MTVIQFIDFRFCIGPMALYGFLWYPSFLLPLYPNLHAFSAIMENEQYFETDFEIDLILDYLLHDSSIDGILLGKTTKVMNLFFPLFL